MTSMKLKLGAGLFALLGYTGAAFSDGSPISRIPAYEQGLIDTFKNCIDNAISQGINTAEGLSTECSNEKSALDAAIPNLSSQIIEYKLNS